MRNKLFLNNNNREGTIGSSSSSSSAIITTQSPSVHPPQQKPQHTDMYGTNRAPPASCCLSLDESLLPQQHESEGAASTAEAPHHNHQGPPSCDGQTKNNPSHMIANNNPREERAYQQMQTIVFVMDEAFTIPGCQNRRVGIDPLIGLIPGLGDCASALVSVVVVARAAPHLSRYTVLHMLVNVWIDAVTGVVPVLGDVFDVGWKANARNLALFEEHMKIGAQAQHNADKKWLIMMVVGFVVVICLTTTLVFACVVLLILWLCGYFNNN